VNTITELETTIGLTPNNGPSITRIWHCGQHTIRARVAHDSYEQQSYAVAEVLTPNLAWTRICEIPAREFHVEAFARVPKPKPTEDQLLELADQLMRRACRILRVPVEQ
jgi:hypothetical protein